MCIRQHKILVYINTEQDTAFADYSSPTNQNKAFFKDEKLHCAATDNTVSEVTKATIKTVTVTETGVMPALDIIPTDTDMFVMIKIGSQHLAPKDIPGLKIYPNIANPTVFLTAADFTDFKLNNMGTYNLVNNWPEIKASSDSWEGNFYVDIEYSGGTTYLLTLEIYDLYKIAIAYIRHPWN